MVYTLELRGRGVEFGTVEAGLMKQHSRNRTPKFGKAYSAPRLTVYGSVEKLTGSITINGSGGKLVGVPATGWSPWKNPRTS